jgi:serine/threonine protein kinase
MPESAASEIFSEIYQLPPEMRTIRLRELAGGDGELIELVESLLGAYDRNPLFLDSLQSAQLTSDVDFQPGPIPFEEGSQIGPYRVIRTLGRGGMGKVLLVEQHSPIQRRLALKLISATELTSSSIDRFELERQTLALLEHPYIARVIDGGTIHGQLPWFVMEYVDGVSLGEHLKSASTDLKARISLFLKICEAIRHAHHKGVIHRDIKPSNILVQSIENHTIPKVIDFGLAKWLEVAADQPASHDSGQLRVLGTLPYVCPEQLGHQKMAADVRSDIYGLGMILYEMIAGQTPFRTAGESETPSDIELFRRIRDEEPVRPSRSLNLKAGSASRYRTDLHRLPRSMADDLDWITLKCLAKEPARRYENVAELVTDIRNALQSRPVSAGPPSVRYRTSKFIRRNRVWVGAGVALAGMIASLTIGLIEAKSARKIAQQRLIEAITANAKLQKAREDIESINGELNKALAASEKSRDEAEAVSLFLSETFASPRPGQRGVDVKVVDLIRDSIKKLSNGYQGSQAARGQLLLSLGNTLRAFGEYEESLPPLKQAMEILEKERGTDSQEYISSVCQLGRSLNSLNREAEAIALYEKAIRQFEATGKPQNTGYRSMFFNLGTSQLKTGRTDEALVIYQKLESVILKLTPIEHFELAMVRSNIAGIYSSKGQNEKAIPILRKSLAELEAELGAGYPHTITQRHSLAYALADSSPGEAEGLLRENEKWIKAKIAPELPIFSKRMTQLADDYSRIGLTQEQKRIKNELKSARSKKSISGGTP